jgi:AraC-like DNA-binding protein
MGYREHPAPPALSELVECGWTNELPADAPPEIVRILPDGCMDLVWTGADVVVAGPDTAPYPYRPTGGPRMAGLRFAPGRLPALLGVPAAALRDQRVPLGELRPALARAAIARLELGAPPAAVLDVLTRQLCPTEPDPAVAVVVRQARGGRSAASTADALGWTTRSLHRRCLDWFGYGPSVLRRVLRFREATALLRAGMAPAEVAAMAGYADQPHLSREVRALAGTAPGQLASGA